MRINFLPKPGLLTWPRMFFYSRRSYKAKDRPSFFASCLMARYSIILLNFFQAVPIFIQNVFRHINIQAIFGFLFQGRSINHPGNFLLLWLPATIGGIFSNRSSSLKAFINFFRKLCFLILSLSSSLPLPGLLSPALLNCFQLFPEIILSGSFPSVS